jgi:hypothetical protein
LIKAGFLIDRAEKTRWAIGSLGWSEQKISSGIQCVVDCIQNLLLDLVIEINEHVAAGDEIDP